MIEAVANYMGYTPEATVDPIKIDDYIIADDITRQLISILDEFYSDLDKVEFVGRARKLARDIKNEAQEEIRLAAKGRGVTTGK